MIRKSLTLTAAFLLVSAFTAMACGGGASGTAEKAKGAMINTDEPQQVTLKGNLTCSSCALKASGAQSSCSEFGCTHALKTSDGRLVSLMQNKFSKDLISNKDNHNKPVEITGTFFANANTLDVKTFAVDGGQTKSWCGHCKSMDACMAKSSGSH